jgi:hypothetical protein
MFDGFMPQMESGDIMGHEFMGVVEDALLTTESIILTISVFAKQSLRKTVCTKK